MLDSDTLFNTFAYGKQSRSTIETSLAFGVDGGLGPNMGPYWRMVAVWVTPPAAKPKHRSCSGRGRRDAAWIRTLMWRLHEVTRDAWACFPQGPCLGMQRNAGLEDQHGGQLQSLNASDLRAAVSVPRQDAHIAVSGLGDELCQPEWQAKNFTKGVGSRHCSVAIFRGAHAYNVYRGMSFPCSAYSMGMVVRRWILQII